MKKQYTYKPLAIRFRRWSRKKYAAFISVKNAVTIGTLSANVSERFQAKNGSVHTSVLSMEQGDNSETEEEDMIVDNWLKTDIPFLQLPQLLLIRTVKQPVAAANAHTLINNISGKAEGFSVILNPSAFSIYTNTI